MTVTDDSIKEHLGVCGLNCGKCIAYVKGDIKRHATELSRLLGNFDIYAERFSKFAPVFSNYPSFKELLARFTAGSCHGCRSGECIYPDCGVISCYKEKGVDFCFQCDEFPCEKTNFDPHLKARWITMNERMKEIGVEGYWEETKDQPRYR
jgi:hypothetical protein